MGTALSAVKQRKLRLQQRKKIFCAEKHNRDVLLPEIPKKCRMVIMKEMSKEFRSLYPYVKAKRNEPSIDEQRITKACPMVIMKEMSKQLQSLSKDDGQVSSRVRRLIYSEIWCGENWGAVKAESHKTLAREKVITDI